MMKNHDIEIVERNIAHLLVYLQKSKIDRIKPVKITGNDFGIDWETRNRAEIYFRPTGSQMSKNKILLATFF